MNVHQPRRKTANRLAQVLNALRRDRPITFLKKLLRYMNSRLSVYKSQKGQDRWVLETLHNKQNGYFVDLAASDGVTFNNTWVMEKKYNWKGIAIEPNPYFYPSLAKSRRCTTLETVIDSKAGITAFRIDNGGLGGIVSDDTDNSAQARGDELEHAEIAQLSAKTLTAVLDEAEAPATIDYLSVDVEGAEERVLRGLNLDRYTFYCMTIEQPNEAVHKLLVEHGYQFVKNEQSDTFYVHQSHPFFNEIERSPFEPVNSKKH